MAPEELEENTVLPPEELEENTVLAPVNNLDYLELGATRLYAGNSGWSYRGHSGLSEQECAEKCTADENCNGYATDNETCLIYNTPQNTNAPYASQCSAPPFSYKEGNIEHCKGSFTGTLYWKNK